jgi:hypothetical protein
MKPLILLFLPFTVSAQVTLTPMEVRRANVLLDHRDRLIDQRRADSLELSAYRDALSHADALQRHTEAMLTETTAQVDGYTLRASCVDGQWWWWCGNPDGTQAGEYINDSNNEQAKGKAMEAMNEHKQNQ